MENKFQLEAQVRHETDCATLTSDEKVQCWKSGGRAEQQ